VAIATRLRVSVLGEVTVGGSTFVARQNRLLFAYLVAEHGRAVPRDELADALWAGAPPATWEKVLTVVASKVRAMLAEAGVDGSVLTSEHGCYRLELPEGTWIDILEATRAVDDAGTALRAGDLETARERGELAASLARLPFLPGEDAAWVNARRRELERVRAQALAVLSDASLEAGDAAQAATWARQAIELEPFHEAAYRRLMEAHIAAGNRAEAFQIYERCRRLLADELGAYPSPETEAIYRRLLDQPSGDGEESSADRRPTTMRRRRRKVLLVAASIAIGGIVTAAFAVGGGRASPRVLPNSLTRIDVRTLKVTRVIRVGDAPDLVVESGGYIWITNHVLRGVDSGALRNAGDRTLTRVDPSTGDSVVVGGGLAPCGLARDPSGDVWVANCYAPRSGSRDNVVRVDARTLAFKATWSVVGGDGFYRGLTYGGGYLWISEIAGGDQPNQHGVTRIDPRTGAEHTYYLTREASGLAWSAKGHDLWIDNFFGGSLMRLQPAKGAIQTIEGVSRSPAFPVANGSVVWIADWRKPQIVRLEAADDTEPHPISLPVRTSSGVWALAAGADAIWAATPEDSAVWRINPRTNALTRVRLRYRPTGVAADAHAIWVTVRGG
jgi:DNA-binding SARP family transcriptional activator/sugar lactone lactonase YvrE